MKITIISIFALAMTRIQHVYGEYCEQGYLKYKYVQQYFKIGACYEGGSGYHMYYCDKNHNFLQSAGSDCADVFKNAKYGLEQKTVQNGGIFDTDQSTCAESMCPVGLTDAVVNDAGYEFPDEQISIAERSDASVNDNGDDQADVSAEGFNSNTWAIGFFAVVIFMIILYIMSR